MARSPLSIVKERFGEDRREAKRQLVDAVRAAGKGLWLDRLNQDKGLELVSNKKLLELEATFKQVRETFGNREDLIAEILKLSKHEKDADYQARLESQSTPQLWDVLKGLKKKHKAS